MNGRWIRAGGEWETKEFAEMDVDTLRERGYEARLNSTTKPVKTPFGTITGKRWFAQKFWPEGADDFRGGKWMRRIDKDGDLSLDNLEAIE